MKKTKQTKTALTVKKLKEVRGGKFYAAKRLDGEATMTIHSPLGSLELAHYLQ